MRRRQLKPVSRRFYPRTLHKEFVEASGLAPKNITPASLEFHPSGENICSTKTFLAKWHLSVRGSTFQNILLHLNLVEFVGANNDAVASEVDAAARL